MPKRSERDDYSEVFDRNPFEGIEAEEMYGEIQWGNDPKATYDFDAPEPMAALGDVAGLDVDGDIELFDDDGQSPFIAVGRDSNNIYLVPKSEGGGPVDVPKFNPRSGSWRKLGRVRQTDYYSGKGGEDAYYYHAHQGPFPTLWEHTKSGCRVMVPAKYKGKRSYAVGKDGIVG